jgi:hypothetical protein
MAAIELRDLRYLTASAVAGNFARAAESLGLNASTISRRIAHLEDELGVTLFERGLAAVLISLFGWILALRGLTLMALPGLYERIGTSVTMSPDALTLIRGIFGVVVVIGLYLTM